MSSESSGTGSHLDSPTTSTVDVERSEDIIMHEASWPPPDIIIGADVILWPNAVAALLLSIKWLLQLNPRLVIK